MPRKFSRTPCWCPEKPTPKRVPPQNRGGYAVVSLYPKTHPWLLVEINRRAVLSTKETNHFKVHGKNTLNGNTCFPFKPTKGGLPQKRHTHTHTHPLPCLVFVLTRALFGGVHIPSEDPLDVWKRTQKLETREKTQVENQVENQVASGGNPRNQVDTSTSAARNLSHSAPRSASAAAGRTRRWPWRGPRLKARRGGRWAPSATSLERLFPSFPALFLFSQPFYGFDPILLGLQKKYQQGPFQGLSP